MSKFADTPPTTKCFRSSGVISVRGCICLLELVPDVASNAWSNIDSFLVAHLVQLGILSGPTLPEMRKLLCFAELLYAVVKSPGPAVLPLHPALIPLSRCEVVECGRRHEGCGHQALVP